jgi:hypothetical protein
MEPPSLSGTVPAYASGMRIERGKGRRGCESGSHKRNVCMGHGCCPCSCHRASLTAERCGGDLMEGLHGGSPRAAVPRDRGACLRTPWQP